MRANQISDWIVKEFGDVGLAIPSSTIDQKVEDAIEYWNGHSAFKVHRMVDFTTTQVRVQLDADIKYVFGAYPASDQSSIFTGHPTWQLLGLTLLDNVNTDLILLNEAFKNYRYYVGADFHWDFVPSTDPTVGGYLYVKNFHSSVAKLYIEASKRIAANEDIKNEVILNWIKFYSLALVKISEGITLRKAGFIGIKNDGSDLVSEGKDEKQALEDKLEKEGRWSVMGRRH